MQFVVENNVPPPSKHSSSPKSHWNVVRSLKPGQSVFLPDDVIGGGKTKPVRMAGSIACQAFGPGNYASRALTENGVKGVRIWRIA